MAPTFEARAQTVAAPTAADVLGRADARADRIAELEAQLLAATAEQERLQYELSQAHREIRRLETVLAEATPAPVQDGDPALSDAQRAAVGNLAAPAPVQRASAQRAPAAPAPPRADPALAPKAYSDARVLLSAGRHAEAEEAFTTYLRDYPDTPQAADVRFFLPYTALARGNFQGAAQGFLDYLQRYREGARTPEAYARLGMALAGLGRKDDACAAFARAQRQPRVGNSVRDLAAREAAALSCP